MAEVGNRIILSCYFSGMGSGSETLYSYGIGLWFKISFV